jgi:hypothetical protein
MPITSTDVSYHSYLNDCDGDDNELSIIIDNNIVMEDIEVYEEVVESTMEYDY